MATNRTLANTIGKWLFFSVLASLLPIMAQGIILLLRMESSPSLEILTSNGSFLLVSAGIAADALGSVIGNQNPKKTEQTWLGGFVFLLFSTSTWVFAETGRIITQEGIQSINLGSVSTLSVSLLIVTIVVSLFCVIVSEE